MDTADVVLRFLESVGRRSEAEYYVGLFRSDPKEQFAAISVDANVARHATEAVVLDLRFLAALGLTPTVVLGLFGPQDAMEHATKIHRRLNAAGVRSQLLDAKSENLHEQAKSAARSGVIPIVPFGAAQGISLDERFDHFGRLLTALHTRKAIFLHRPGGLRQKGVLAPVVNLSADYETLVASDELSRKEKLLLAQSRRLVLHLVPHKLVVAITSPLNLFRELFTVKGAGTLLRRGARIHRHEALEDLDRSRLNALLVSSFGRAPFPSFFERPLSRLYVEENYRGAALVQTTPFGGYLTKFAVNREAQGEGIARDLWEKMHADFPTLFWRARPSNPITEWYTKLCDGLARFPDWHVYWTGLPPERITSAIEFALAQPVDLPPAQSAPSGPPALPLPPAAAK